MSVAYPLDARLALVAAMQHHLPTPNEAKLMLIVTQVFEKLDEAGWTVVTKNSAEYAQVRSQREEQNRQYHYRSATGSWPPGLEESVADIQKSLDDINHWINKVTELAEQHLGIVIEP
jgi:hypothetical protein